MPNVSATRVIGEVALQYLAQVSLIQNHNVVQTLTSNRPDQPLDKRVLPGTPGCGKNLLCPQCGAHLEFTESCGNWASRFRNGQFRESLQSSNGHHHKPGEPSSRTMLVRLLRPTSLPCLPLDCGCCLCFWCSHTSGEGCCISGSRNIQPPNGSGS